MESVDCIVVGMGIIDLAVARALAAAGQEVIVIESESQIGAHTSSRNSEIIHAPAYAGVRPKITPPSALAADFRIWGPSDHGIRGLVNLFGIELPGLMASLALADLVVEQLLH